MNGEEEHIFILLEAVRSMDAADAAALRDYLWRASPEIAQELAAAEDAVAALPLTIAAVAPPAGLRGALMGRVNAQARRDADAPVRIADVRKAPARSATGWMRYAVAAGLGLAIGMAAWQFAVTKPKADRIAAFEARVTDQDARIGELNAMLGSRNTAVFAINGAEQPKAGGRVVWDKDRGQWRVYVFDLKPPAAGREFELWFITKDQKKIPSKTFRVDASGNGSVTVDVPKDAGLITLAAITDEPLGGVLQPTGQIHLAGEVK